MDFLVRPLEDDQLRAANNVFRGSLHTAPSSDERWTYTRPLYEPGRTFGAIADGRIVGTALSFTSGLAVPGGLTLPMAAVTGVGVRADFRRRGVLTELMRAQLTEAVAHGDVFAGLHASEGAIYGRFGYGVGTVARHPKVKARRAALRPDLPHGGEVRLLDNDEILARLPGLYELILGSRPGMMARSPGWWSIAYERRVRSDELFQVAVHRGPDGEDGFVAYLPKEPDPTTGSLDSSLQVLDFHAGTAAAAIDLWRFLLGVDLVEEVVAWSRPVDEPLEAMLVDRHVMRADLDDDLWVRLLDVPAALAGRSYGDASPVVIEVRDSLLPANSGRYRVGPQGTERVSEPAELAMDTDVLAMIYLGAMRPSVLASVGRIDTLAPAVFGRADRLFAVDVAACCGTMF